MEEIIDLLHRGNFACVIRKGDDIRTFTRRGVADLFELINVDPSFLKGATIADKVVGKAAAALMVLGGINCLYTDVVSSRALELLRGGAIDVSFHTEVPVIINRDKTDSCPLEKLCQYETSAEAILLIISNFINANNKPVT